MISCGNYKTLFACSPNKSTSFGSRLLNFGSWCRLHGVSGQSNASGSPGRPQWPLKGLAALAIAGEHDGLALDRPPFRLEERREVPQIATGPRIGITRAAELPWRYGLLGSPFLSRVLRSA
jgi:hypothetical protein